MKRVEMSQGSTEWLAWRRAILTASDAGVIMECNPYMTTMLLRRRKLGLSDEEPWNPAMQRGHDLEPIARSKFVEQYSIHMEPAVGESEYMPFLGASFDGISNCGKYLLEIKCGKKSYRQMQKSIIPPYYSAQMQHQMIVSGAEKCYYYCYDDETDTGLCLEILPNTSFVKEYLPRAERFWMDLIFNTKDGEEQ